MMQRAFCLLLLCALLLPSAARAESDTPQLNHHVYLPAVANGAVGTDNWGSKDFNCPVDAGGAITFISPFVPATVGLHWRFRHNDGIRDPHREFTTLFLPKGVVREAWFDMSPGWTVDRVTWTSHAVVTVLDWRCAF